MEQLILKVLKDNNGKRGTEVTKALIKALTKKYDFWPHERNNPIKHIPSKADKRFEGLLQAQIHPDILVNNTLYITNHESLESTFDTIGPCFIPKSKPKK